MTTSASDTDSEAPSAATAQGTATTQVVFIDSRTPDIADLLAGLAPGEQAFVLDPTQDGLQQIAQVLATDHLSDLSSISLIGHGASGQMLLGSTVLDEGDLGAHASDLAQIGAALSASGDLSLYGCDVAQGAQGREFIADLSKGLGGTDVAAATHLVGSADLGGSFALDASTGAPVGANPSPFTAQSLAAYEGVLATPQANAIQGDPDVFILSNSGGTHNQLQSASDTGTYPATPATYFTDGSNEPGGVLNTNTTRVTVDPANNVYFLTVENDTGGATSVNKVVSGALTQLGSGTPSLTTLYSDNAPNQSNLDGSSEAANIEGLALDPVGKVAYFTEGDQFKSVSYSGGSASTLGTASGTPNYLIGLALDAPDHTAYFGAREEVVTTVATAHGSKYTTTAQNALWKDANIQTPGQALSKLPLATGNGAGQLPGVIEDVALDPGRQYLYITTGSTAGSADGIYKYALTGNSSGAVTTVYSVPSTMEQTFGDIVVDAQGKYYVSVEINNASGGIFVGSTSGGTPREFVQVPLASDGGGAEPIDAAVDLPPTLTLGSPNYSQALQGGPALQLMTGLPTASEPSGGDLAGATISLGGSYKSSDVLSVTAGGNITAFYNAGTLTLSGVDTVAHYEQVLESLTYQDTGSDASTGYHPTRTASVTLTDGLLTSAAVTQTVTIDRAPTAATHTASVAAGATTSASSAIDTDPDADTLTVTALTGGTAGAARAGTYGTLTLSANDTYSYAATNAAALASAPTGSHPTDSFTYTVSDGLGGTTSETLRFTIDRAPLLGGLSPAVSYTQGASAVTLSAGATTSDPDGDMIGSATIAIAAAQAGDVLSAVVTGTSITASYNSTTGVLSLSGADTAAHYQQVLDSIAFSASTETAATYSPAVSRTISFQTTDALGLASLGGSETVNLNVVFADTAANVASKLDSLQANVASVSSITITDGAPLAITAAQDSSDAMALAKIAGPYMLDVTGVAGQPYTGFSQSFDANKLLTSETLSGYSQATYGYASLVESFDTLGRVTQQTYETSSGATVQSNAITYNNDGTSSETVSGFTGEPYTSYTQSFSSTGQLTSETQSGYDMASYGYASVTDTYDSQGRITDQLYKTDTNTTQHEVMFAYSTSDNSYTETVTGVTGTDYTGYSQSFDTNGHLVGETLSGFPASYGYASVVDTFDSSGRVTSQAYEDSSGATERSVSLSYSTSDNSFTETVTGVTGQDYTGYSQSFDTNGHMSGETLSGYDMATFGYASVVETFDTMGRLTGQTFETNTNTVQHSVAIAYNSDSSHAVTYSGIQGQSFTGYTQDFDASNTLLAEQITNTDGSRTDDAFANDQTFASVSVNQSQNAVGTAETFVIAAGFAEVTINGYQPGQDSFDISSSLFADFNALIAHATPDGANATLITYDAQESFVILGATIAQLQSHSSDFHFV